MKQNIIAIAAITAAISAQAQQLQNNGFEDNWAQAVPWTSDGNTKTMEKTEGGIFGFGGTTVKLGFQPANWHIAHVIGMSGTGQTEVGKQIEGYNSDKAVQLTNTANSIASSQIVPGYLTLGTPWNTSVMGNKNDGGTFGGIQFTYRPDAMQFYYKRSHGTEGDETPATVVAYAWKGHTTQANVPGNIVALFSDPTKCTMTDRDRNILGINTTYGDNPSQSDDFKLIAKINTEISGDATGWTKKTVTFQYPNGAEKPAMFNVIFAAGKYFEVSQNVNDQLCVDDVKLLYYSQLATLNVANFSATTYTYNVTVPCYESIADAQAALQYTVKGVAATAEKTNHVEADGLSGTTMIVVTNADGTDASNVNTHTYTIKYTKAAAPAGTQHIGKLDILMNGMPLANGDKKAVYINTTAEGTTFTLPEFALGDMSFGDIIVPNLEVTRNNNEGRTYYKGHVEAMQLMNGAIEAKVDVKGYIADNGDIFLNIPVKWLNDGNEVPIAVRFYSESCAGYTSATLSLKQGWGYGTFCAPFETVMPSGVTAYQVNGIKANGCVDMEALESVPANTPVIIAGSEGVEQDYYGEAVEGTPATNYMTGTYQTVQATADTYVLQNKSGVVAFYHVASGKEPIVGANRCWLNATASGVKALYFDTTTGLDAISRPAATEVYDLTGRCLTRAAKGVNIVNGKKIIVK